jgi:predicted small metal-binding protein
MVQEHPLVKKYKFRCKDAGLACKFEVEGRTRDSLYEEIREHVREHHEDINLNDPHTKKLIYEAMEKGDTEAEL